MNPDTGFDLPPLPSHKTLQDFLRPFEMLLTDGILWLSYAIACLASIKLIVHLINGREGTSKSNMGSSPVEYTTSLYRTHREDLI